MTGYEIVDLVHINEEKQIAVIKKADGHSLGVNLWEIAGYTRQADNFTCWKYALTGE